LGFGFPASTRSPSSELGDTCGASDGVWAAIPTSPINNWNLTPGIHSLGSTLERTKQHKQMQRGLQCALFLFRGDTLIAYPHAIPALSAEPAILKFTAGSNRAM
jgi:hypothetical protein